MSGVSAASERAVAHALAELLGPTGDGRPGSPGSSSARAVHGDRVRLALARLERLGLLNRDRRYGGPRARADRFWLVIPTNAAGES